mgnify:CR=1 FL=1
MKIITFLIIIFSSNLYAQYYEVLPKGVRTFVFRNIQANSESSYNQTKKESAYSYHLDTNINNLKEIEISTIQEALALLEPYPEAYNKISFGAHYFKASADLNVDAYGIGYGLTKNTTVYMGFPIYQAEVKFNYKRTKGSSINEVAEALQRETDDDYAQTLGNIIEQIYDIDGGVIQSALVNEFNYKELGNWRGEGIGDIELGLMHKLQHTKNYGLKLSLGVVLPTGRVDDPDILQDIGFGDGQLDAFLEFGGSYHINSKNIISSWIRYTHQFANKKELRVLEYKDFALASNKDEFEEKLGDMIDIAFIYDYSVTDWLNLQPALLSNFTQKAKYKSEHEVANELLAENTESQDLSARITANISTVKLYKQKKFLLPGQLNFSYQTTLEGQNVPKVNRSELEFVMFF